MHVGCLLAVDLRPGLAAVNGVISVLSARAVDIGGLTYTATGTAASLWICVIGTPEQVRRLAAQVDRRVDVLAVNVVPGGAA